MSGTLQRCVSLAVCSILILSGTPGVAQDRSERYRSRFRIPKDIPTFTSTRRWCGTTHELLRESQTGVMPAVSLEDGEVIRADQTPRFLRPTHTGEFGFNNFAVLGDHSTVIFERFDPWADSEDFVTTETWERTGTSSVSGRTLSLFTPRWPAQELQDYLRRVRWGIDRPSLLWGRLVLPTPSSEPTFGELATEDERETTAIVINMHPPGIVQSPVTKIDETVQFSSHVVNMWIPGFGNSRITGGNDDLDLEVVTNKFYEHFRDEYDIISVVSQVSQFPGYGGFHRPVRNDIAGIGLEVGDSSGFYGSAGVLSGVEFYPHGWWTSNEIMLHETGHQWGEFSSVWDPLGGPAFKASVLDRKGHDPEVHTPLLTPGAVMYGAVLEATRRVGEVAIPTILPSAHGPSYAIETTMPLITYNPLTLYRMGHLSASDLPTYQVFSDQGQFDEESSTEPEVGTPVEGEHFQVTADDIVAADGPRSGPTISELRRAVVYVSRAGLVSESEMSLVNYFAARFNAQEGVTSWDRYPSFLEATNGAAQMSTAIRPKEGTMPLVPGPEVAYAPVARNALVGMLLDADIPGRITAEEAVTLSGVLTLTDRIDYDGVCFRFRRYGAEDVNEIVTCAPLEGDRFSIELTFTLLQTGTYTVENAAFGPDADNEFPRSWYGTIVVDTGPQPIK